VIKLDIINEVVTAQGSPRPSGARRRNRLREHEEGAHERRPHRLRGFGVFNVRPRKTASAAIRVPAPKFPFPGQSRSLQAGQGTAIDRLAGIAEVRVRLAE